MQSENCTGGLTAYNCILHQETLCAKALKFEHVISSESQTVIFKRANGLNHRMFKSFLEEIPFKLGDVLYREKYC